MDAASPDVQIHAPAAAATDAELKLRHLEVAARYLFTNLLPLPLVVIGLAVLLYQWHGAAPLAAWASVTIATWGVTIAMLQAFLQDERRGERTARWTVAICASLLISSSALAGVSALFWVEGDRLNNVLLYVVVAAGLACAGAQSAPSLPVAVTNLAPYAVTFVFLSLAHEPFPGSLGFAFLQLCYVVLVGLYAKTVWQLSDEMLRLRSDKRALIERLQRALKETMAAQKRAEGASQAKSEFLASMSHELRTPLNAVLGFSEIIRDRTLGEDAGDRYREYAAHIHFSGRHLLGLINDVLDLSKIEAGRRELAVTSIDLVAFARDVLRFVESQAEAKGLTLGLEAPQAATVLADERALRQVLANLLSNAVKFTPRGGRVTLRLLPGDQGGIVIAVADTGIGIRPEDMDKVLECFGQARHDIATTDERGTGLGLPIAKGLVELHGGTLAIESQEGRGTIVKVELPAARVSLGPRITEAA